MLQHSDIGPSGRSGAVHAAPRQVQRQALGDQNAQRDRRASADASLAMNQHSGGECRMTGLHVIENRPADLQGRALRNVPKQIPEEKKPVLRASDFKVRSRIVQTDDAFSP